jgi:thioredoxin-dependent peroxiredoxin
MAKPRVGDPAPDFELDGTDGPFKLSDHRGERVVLLFYPGDNTAVCTKQFCSYRDNAADLDSLGVPLLGISPQSVDSHERFAEEKRLNVPLLADEDMKVAAAYGVKGWGSPLAWLAERKAVTPGGFFTQRAIFVVDGEGVVRHHVSSFTGATYESVEDLRPAVEALGVTSSASS